MNRISAVIIDDEESARETLSRMIRDYCPEVEIKAVAGSAGEGISIIKDHKPGLVFLDVEMPPVNGFDMLEKLNDISFEVVFTTAYSHYALKAIKFSALDYLLKPINGMELKAAVRKVHERKNQQLINRKLEAFIENITSKNRQLNKLVIPLSAGYKVVEIKDIVRCQSDKNYTEIHLSDKSKLLAGKTLREFEDMLADYNFLRIHQSHLINLDQVKFYTKGRESEVELSDGSVVDIARSKKEIFIKKIGIKH